MRRQLFFIMFMLLILPAVASDYHIYGVVTDSVGEGEPYATLRVFAEIDSVKPVAMSVTDGNGVFRMDLPGHGRYDLSVSATGRDNIERSFELSAEHPSLDLGELKMVTASNLLGVVEVVAQRPLVSREIDRIGYDVQADGDAKTSQLDDMLRKVPMVSVDDDGTIKVNGSSEFKIYKNGRPNSSYSKNAKDIFKAIPASMIKKIEVITDPGAREDAEGVSAILNIVTMSNTVVSGVLGQANISASSNNLFPQMNLWLTTQLNKVTFSVSGGYSKMNHRQTRSRSKETRIFDDNGNVLTSANMQTNPGHIMWGSGEFSWELDSMNLFTAEFEGYSYRLKPCLTSETSLWGADGSPIYSYRTAGSYSPWGYLDFNGNFNYQHLTALKGEVLTLSYAISTTRQEQKGATEYEDIYNIPVAYTRHESDFDLRFAEHTVQADWTRPIAEKHKIDVGGKFIYRDNHSVTTNIYDPVESDHTDFIHTTTIGALYTDYRVSLGKWSARAGLRYEYSRLSAKYRDGSQQPFSSTLNDLVPNVSVAWNATDASSFKLSYSTSIKRPGISYLNPAVDETPIHVSYGNPDLESARHHDVNFNYGLIRKNLNINFTISYNFSNDGIISVMDTRDNVTYSTYANAGRTHRVVPSLYANWNIGKNTSLMLNGRTQWERQANPSAGISASGWTYNVYTRLTQKLPCKIIFSLGGSLWSGYRSLYTVYYAPSFVDRFSYNASLRRSFLKDDRLTVAVSLMNIGLPGMDRKSRPVNSGYSGQSLHSGFNRQMVYMSVGYRFGSLNASVKKTAKTITNDDLDGRKN